MEVRKGMQEQIQEFLIATSDGRKLLASGPVPLYCCGQYFRCPLSRRVVGIPKRCGRLEEE
jgi:hypothetical protein